MTTGNVAHIRGWITPRLERVLQRAAEISADHGYDYLAVEHLALAMIEDKNSVPSQVWQGSMTADEWRQALLGSLPEAAASDRTATEPVRIEVSRDPLPARCESCANPGVDRSPMPGIAADVGDGLL
jgi:ATP-dependent Clp protease ATP-binding subunit ClpA